MTEQRLILNRQWRQLEMDKVGIEHAIDEIQRRFALLEEVESWGLLVQDAPSSDHPAGDNRHDNHDKPRVSGIAVDLVPAGDSINGLANRNYRSLVA